MRDEALERIVIEGDLPAVRRVRDAQQHIVRARLELVRELPGDAARFGRALRQLAIRAPLIGVDPVIACSEKVRSGFSIRTCARNYTRSASSVT